MLNRQRPVIAVIGGSDSAGLAGIQMDNRCADALGVHAMTVISTVTAQTNQGVLLAEPVLDTAFARQLEAAAQFPVQAIKIGVLGNRRQLELVCDFIRRLAVPVVWDPVMISSSGGTLSQLNTSLAIQALLPQVTLVTPNLPELTCFSGSASLVAAADDIIRSGADAVLIKGGHDIGDQCLDYFHGGNDAFCLGSPRQLTGNTRGSGCALATAITSALALGYALKDSVVIAKAAISQGLRQAYGLETGEQGPVRITGFPDRQDDMPWLVSKAVNMGPRLVFPDCGDEPLGLYPIVDRASWLARLLPSGVTTIQLRVKDLTGEALCREIEQAISIARQYQCRLFINDHWALAIELGAYGVHLGQEDLDSADLEQIHSAGLRLGISTHCHHEVARALALQPSYIACGPVYPTTTKQMPWQPHGINGLRYWQRTLSDYPLVAIGGINEARIDAVAETGVSGIALITAITKANDPEQACLSLLQRSQSALNAIK